MTRQSELVSDSHLNTDPKPFVVLGFSPCTELV